MLYTKINTHIFSISSYNITHALSFHIALCECCSSMHTLGHAVQVHEEYGSPQASYCEEINISFPKQEASPGTSRQWFLSFTCCQISHGAGIEDTFHVPDEEGNMLTSFAAFQPSSPQALIEFPPVLLSHVFHGYMDSVPSLHASAVRCHWRLGSLGIRHRSPLQSAVMLLISL
jgi:hypothetical protein